MIPHRRPSGRDLLVRSWSQRGALRNLLRPLSWGYGVAMAGRRLAFRVGLTGARPVGVPVVSIGNLTVGGTGKTPAALWLADRLRESGRSPAIVTRGYGGTLEGRTAVVGRGHHALLGVDEIGDEATLLAERFGGSVVCGSDRVAAAELAVTSEGADTIVLDDGFQHWRLARDFDLVLVDGRSGFGNGSLLPAGPLREPLGALRRADAIAVTKTAPVGALAERLRRYAEGVPLFSADLAPQCLVAAEEGELRTQPLGDLVGRNVVIVSAIAEPESFYALLGQLEARPVEVLEYPDHHRFTQADWHDVNMAARRADLVVCTEKDLVKLRRFPFARGGLFALRVAFRLSSPEEEERLCGRIREAIESAEKLRPRPERANQTRGEAAR